MGFYAGATYQKSIISNVTELLQSPKPSINPSVEPTPTRDSEMTSKPTLTSLPTSTPTPPQLPTNTSDPNSPTFIKVSSPNGGESFKVGDSINYSNFIPLVSASAYNFVFSMFKFPIVSTPTTNAFAPRPLVTAFL